MPSPPSPLPEWEKRASEAEAAEVVAGQSQEQNHDPDLTLRGDSKYFFNDYFISYNFIQKVLLFYCIVF